MVLQPGWRWQQRGEEYAWVVPVEMSDDAGPGSGQGFGEVTAIPSAVGENGSRTTRRPTATSPNARISQTTGLNRPNIVSDRPVD